MGKDICGYDDYTVDIDGNIFSKKTNKYMKQSSSKKDWYKVVGLTKYGKTKTFTIHSIVASHFIPLIAGKNNVNHKDGNKQNNNATNLEWCTHGENIQHAYDTGLCKPYWLGITGSKNPNSKMIRQYSKSGIFIEEFGSMVDAENTTGIARQNISMVCLGKRKFAGGYAWEYK